MTRRGNETQRLLAHIERQEKELRRLKARAAHMLKEAEPVDAQSRRIKGQKVGVAKRRLRDP